MSSLTTAAAVAYNPNDWLSGRKARSIAGVTPSRLWQLVAAGQVRSIAPPGVAVKFSREDVERVSAELKAVRKMVRTTEPTGV